MSRRGDADVLPVDVACELATITMRHMGRQEYGAVRPCWRESIGMIRTPAVTLLDGSHVTFDQRVAANDCGGAA